MKRTSIALLSAALIASGSVVGATPANADEAPANVCVHKVTGVIRNSADPTCSKNELAIGATALTPGTTRPKKLDPLFANRIKVAKLLAKKKGIYIGTTAGWRSVNFQQTLFKRAVKKYGSPTEASKWVLPAEYSLHPWGLAIDVNFGSRKKLA